MPFYMQVDGVDGTVTASERSASGEENIFSFDLSAAETGAGPNLALKEGGGTEANRLFVGNLSMSSTYEAQNTGDGSSNTLLLSEKNPHGGTHVLYQDIVVPAGSDGFGGEPLRFVSAGDSGGPIHLSLLALHVDTSWGGGSSFQIISAGDDAPRLPDEPPVDHPDFAWLAPKPADHTTYSDDLLL